MKEAFSLEKEREREEHEHERVVVSLTGFSVTENLPRTGCW